MKTLTACVAFATAMIVGALQANAQTFCLELVPFCDQVQVTVQGNVVFGLWDGQLPSCNAGLVPVMGTGGFAGGSFTGSLFGGGTVEMWDVDVAARTVDLWQTNGSSAALVQSTIPVNIHSGTCNFALSAGGTSVFDSLPGQ